MHSKKPDCYFNLGNAYLLKEEYKKAMKSFKKCIELDATNSTAIYNLGNTYFISGNKEKAITYFEKAVSMEPDNCEWRNYLGGLYLDQ